MIISVWYFDSESNFTETQERLLVFLKQNDAVGSSNLELDNPKVCAGIDIGNGVPKPGSTDSKTIRTTTFTSDSGSGVFLAINRHLMPERNDLFIQYYGVINSTNRSENAGDIRDLMTMNERPYNLKGTIDGLS